MNRAAARRHASAAALGPSLQLGAAIIGRPHAVAWGYRLRYPPAGLSGSEVDAAVTSGRMVGLPAALAPAGAGGWVAAGIGAGLLVWFGSWLLAPIPQMGGDVLTEFYPWLAYAVTVLQRGALPLWGPYSLAGAPLL